MRATPRLPVQLPLATALAIVNLACLTGCVRPGKVPAPNVSPTPVAAPIVDGVALRQTASNIVVTVDDQLFTEYHFTRTPKPILYPVIGPTGDAMTRNYPMRDAPGEEHDHPHHRSIWFGHGLVNGEDFWTERPSSGRIVHRGFTRLEGGSERAVVQSQNDWVSARGKVICADERTLTFHRGDTNARWIDFTITLRATNGELLLGDTREGTMAVRVAESMRVTHGTGGHIENRAGQTDLGAWGRRAEWCDYSGPLPSGPAGIALLDHPSNPRHPTWWMVRDYGLLAANSFGQHEFENLTDEKAGELRLPAGGSVTFRYRIVLHRGELPEARMQEHFQNFSTSAAIN